MKYQHALLVQKTSLSAPFFGECTRAKRIEVLIQFINFSSSEEYNPANFPCPKLNKAVLIKKWICSQFHNIYWKDLFFSEIPVAFLYPQVVMIQIKPLLNKEYCLKIDNFFCISEFIDKTIRLLLMEHWVSHE